MITKVFSLAAAVFFVNACSSTPVITTHKTRSAKTADQRPQASASKPPQSANTPTAAMTASPTVTAEAAPAEAPVSITLESFKLNEEKNEKPRSNVTYDSDAKKIGVILPVTGKNAAFAQRALNAIRLGLKLEDKNPAYSIVVYDSQSTPSVAAAGVEKLLRDDHVIAIMGGLSSKEAQAISSQAEYFQVPFISFSQKSGLTDDTDYTFRNSVTPEMQVARLLTYAFNTLKAKRFAMLYPNDPYGVEFANKYWNLVLAGGGEIVAAQPFETKDTDLNSYVQKLLGTYHVEARPEEYAARKKEIADRDKKKTAESKGKKKSSREHETQENLLSPIVDFDVLFVPDSGKALGQVIAFMKNNDVTQMTYLGTNLWNTPDLSRRVTGNSAVFFVDASFTPEEQQKSDFHGKYFTQYQEEPTLVEAQIYEAAEILRDIIGSSHISRNSLASELSILGRHSGAYTEIRMNNNHEIERPLNIFSLTEGSIQKTE